MSVLGRRDVVGAAIVALGTGGLVRAARAASLPLTPSQALGPFYPVVKSADSDADLTRVSGRSGRAKGQPIEVNGRVLDRQGRPVAGAVIEIWQANAAGRYAHPADSNTAPLDPDFQGYARLVSDASGRFRFLSIKPAAYPADDGMRAPHIHFDLLSKEQRRVTQVYFPGEPLNGPDQLLSAISEARRGSLMLRPVAASEPGVLGFSWDAVLSG